MLPETVRTPKFTKEKSLSAFAAIIITGVIGYVLSLISVDLFDQYGWGIFVATPFVCGFLSVWIYNRKSKRPLGESLSVAGWSAGYVFLGFFIIGFEGLICIAMAAPIMLPLFFLGGWMGYLFSKSLGKGLVPTFLVILMLLSVPMLMGFNARNLGEPIIRQAVTSVRIKGDVSDVWKEVIQFSPIPEPEEWLFRIGIAYPTSARIEGEGVGAIRYCNFSTGAFVEPITLWEENRLLAFDVQEQPIPMTEISPYAGIHPPHLDWAVQSVRGQFLLTDLGDGTVLLEGTTWFYTKMGPEVYWSRITEGLIQLIHERVLNHIKDTVEGA